MDELPLPPWLQITDQEMMDNPVPEMGCWRRRKLGQKWRGCCRWHKAVIHSPDAAAHPEQGDIWAVGNRRTGSFGRNLSFYNKDSVAIFFDTCQP